MQCDCCDQDTDIYYEGPFCSINEIEALCPSLENIAEDLSQSSPYYTIESVQKYCRKDGDMQGYLFQCLHCGKYRSHMDSN